MVDIIKVCAAAMLSACVHTKPTAVYVSRPSDDHCTELADHQVAVQPAGLTVAVATPCDAYDHTES